MVIPWRARRPRRDAPAVPTPAVDERELVRRARAGDGEAFAVLVRAHGDAIYRLALRMVGPDGAEDVAQAAFLRAWQGLDGFGGGAAFGTWLYRIAINLCLDDRRRHSRFRPVPLDDLAGTLSDGYDVAETVVDAAEGEERRAAVARALAALRTRTGCCWPCASARGCRTRRSGKRSG